MIAVDTNVLVYSHRKEVAEHDVARDAVRRMATGRDAWAIPWPCIYEFISVVTNPRIWKDSASTPGQAWSEVSLWLGSPSLRMLAETEGFAEVLGEFATRPRIRGPLIHDARIAALCVAHGATALLSRDRDFSLFPELVVRDPFA